MIDGIPGHFSEGRNGQPGSVKLVTSGVGFNIGNSAKYVGLAGLQKRNGKLCLESSPQIDLSSFNVLWRLWHHENRPDWAECTR